MHNKKTGLVKSSSSFIRRIFRARNIIIISDHKVDHVPLSGTLQVLMIVGLFGLFSGVSYITGSYMTARSTIREKDKAIVNTSLARTKIGEEMDVLKNDLVKLRQNSKDLNAYNKYVIDQHVSQAASLNTPAGTFGNDAMFNQNNDKMANRISYLENRIQEITDDNDHLVTAIRERTDKKIAYFEDIISMTGLDPDHLEHMATSGAKAHGDLTHGPASEKDDEEDEDSAKKDSRPHSDNQGGPFIPASPLSDADHELLANVDRLVMLGDIVKKLPLDYPIKDAQLTGPFGKRVDPLNGRWAIHPGLDMAGPLGSKIYSTSNGTVIAAGHRLAYGNAVDIDHGFGIVTRYGHMSRVLVKEGDVVHTGQLIGIQGSTGRSTGPHLHYEVRINDRPVNPIKFLHAGEYVSENQ